MSLLIDNFAGGGGASTGIRMALGRDVDIAINHDENAIVMHAANHPHTEHLRESLWDVEPASVVRGRRVRVAWFSPDCKHFSRAKGAKPVDNRIRGLAWIAIKWARDCRPECIFLENVREFQDWGPLNNDNLPDPTRRGKTFNRFISAFKRLDYQIEWRILDAADFGAPTHRKRLFLIARCDGLPIRWPHPTHGPADTIFGLHPYRTAAGCIDWSTPCPSIFGRKRPLAEKTMRRIAAGLKRFVILNPNPFIVTLAHGGNDMRCRSADRPLPTQTQKNQHALCIPFTSCYHGQKLDESRCHDVGSPLNTLDTQNRYALCIAWLEKFYGTSRGCGVDRPAPTITAGAGSGHIAEVRAFLIKYYGCGNGQKIDDPAHTITTKDRLGLVMVSGQVHQIIDIGLRMLSPRELARCQGFPEDYILTGTKCNQVQQIGNSVCPQVAAALVKANVSAQPVAQVA